jgi:photosystem II stability/assembly factor-like uncharacterized protein
VTTPRDDRELDALLRQQTERLAPLDGSWELITRRAKRRKWAKASVAVSAGVVIAAGAVPAVIAVHNSAGSSGSGTETVAIGNSTHASAPTKSSTLKPAPITSASSPTATVSTPAVPTTLAGFMPDSLSFVSQSTGYLWGTIGRSHAGVVARTTDKGESWTRLQAPPVEDSASADGVAGDSQIRFASGTVGFVFGSLYYVTNDAGETWTRYSSPGYIDDIEAMHHRVWALARTSKTSTTVRLYSATAADPSLRLVTAVKPMQALPGADAIAVNGASVNVIAGDSAFWTSPDGVQWSQTQDPCQSTSTSGNVQSALLSTYNLGTVVSACGYNVGGSSETKQSYLSHNSGTSWTAMAQSPGSLGSMLTFAAGARKNLVLGTTEGAQFTTDGGTTWNPESANGIPLGFVGYISLHHLVAVSSRAAATTGAFASSTDGGETWTTYSFH